MKVDPRKKAALSIINTLERAGYQAYLVGGCVRDEVLGRVPQDYDVATSALPETVQSLFPKTVPTGLKHGTVTVLIDEIPTEVTTYRVEGDYLDHRRPSQVEFVTSLRDDLARRDFTFNAMAQDQEGRFIDFFDGQKDLKEGIVRTVGKAEDRLKEDPLRMLRAIRFAAQFSFRLDEDLFSAIRRFREESRYLSVERVVAEMEKLWKAKWASGGIRLLFETGLAESLPPFRDWTLQVPEPQELSARLDQSNDRIVRWAFLLHMWGANRETAPAMLAACKFSNEDRKSIRFALEWGLHWPSGSVSDWKLRLLAWGLENTLRARLLAEMLREYADGLSPTRDELLAWWNEMPAKNAKDLVINGRDLLDYCRRPPGSWLGEAIRSLTERVAVGELPNEKDVLLKEGCRFAFDTL